MENAGSWRAYFARLRTAAFSRERERVRRVSMNPDSGPFTILSRTFCPHISN